MKCYHCPLVDIEIEYSLNSNMLKFLLNINVPKDATGTLDKAVKCTPTVGLIMT